MGKDAEQLEKWAEASSCRAWCLVEVLKFIINAMRDSYEVFSSKMTGGNLYL